MRQLTDHIVEGDSANHQLSIEVLDQPGQGGANHRYRISRFDTESNGSEESGLLRGAKDAIILFQNGPIKEFGVNGVTQEALLAIVIDRLECFQRGQFACEDNAFALAHCKAALLELQRRTRARIA